MVLAEVSKCNDEFATWIVGVGLTHIDHRNLAIFSKYREVLTHIQTSTELYNSKALAEWSDNNRADAWLVATAMAFGYKLVTFERPNNSLGTTLSSHLKIPAVAGNFGVKCCSLYEMMRDLAFKFS
ncbi:MAG: DUF4411 family protein [Clostridiales bacterium]|nr:DUF4411 family protein [Clostridiales bacterium]